MWNVNTLLIWILKLILTDICLCWDSLNIIAFMNLIVCLCLGCIPVRCVQWPRLHLYWLWELLFVIMKSVVHSHTGFISDSRCFATMDEAAALIRKIIFGVFSTCFTALADSAGTLTLSTPSTTGSVCQRGFPKDITFEWAAAFRQGYWLVLSHALWAAT